MAQQSLDATNRPLSLDQVADRINDVSTLPEVALRVVQVANDARSSASDLKRVLENDPALTARVLRTVNSSYYSLRYNVHSVQQAIALLGFNQIRNLAVTASVADVFTKDIGIRRYSRRELWRHLVSVAVASRMIASRCGLAGFEEAYLAGLLHDWGIILEDQYLHEEFVSLVAQLPEDVRFADAEQAVFGFDHAELGGRIAERWKFPPATLAAIRYHHSSDQCSDRDELPIVQAVELANYLCTSKGISAIRSAPVGKPSLQALESLGVTREDYRVLWEDIDAELRDARSLLTI
ncbi:HDOD domain protein [Planctomycetes bacterium Pan216]|uniref:HDOD domain protein n=1 Tax=Kolteria novifilia TaxID=2527975 RepID=A0A518B5U4_9BACT|nr:HDOD domain protein [Planctomycetes bacterium Pan216]